VKRYIVVAALVGIAAWQIYVRMSNTATQKAGPRGRVAVAVETAAVQKSTVRDIGIFTGTLYPRSQFVVAPKVAGRLEKLHVKMADRVKKGQVIAEIESEEYLQQLDQAKAELEVARANLADVKSALEIASKELERVKTLRQKRIASESELDASAAQFAAQEAKHKVALAQVAQKDAALKASQVRLSYTEIRASWEEGDSERIVGERFVDEGAMLAANTPIVSVLDISVLTGVIHVIEKDYPKMRIGRNAEIHTDAYPGQAFSGRVARIAPLVKEMTRTARVELEIINSDGLLKPGMFIRAQIEFSVFENATVVPVDALTKRGGRPGVFIADRENLKARFSPAEIGLTDQGLLQILSPEIVGEVVTLGHHLLEDGSTIILAEKDPGARKPGPAPGEKGPAGSKP